MATATRTLTRALRTPPASTAFKQTTSHRIAIPRQAFRQQSHRSYSSGGPKAPRRSSTTKDVLIGGATLLLFGGGLVYYVRNVAENPFKQSSDAQGQQGSRPFSPTQQDYQKVYDAIAAKLIDDDDYDDGSYGPVLLRLGWHASGTYDKETKTGGSNGATMRFAPERDHGANSGLVAAQKFLESIKQKFLWITYSDLWTLAAVCAIQEMGGPDIPWRPGRQDRDVAYCTPDGRLPDASKDQDHLRNIFYRMGFNDQEIVALSGAHALGRCHTDRSGYDGPWTFSPITLTNDYYKLLVEEKWNWKKWNGPKQFEDTKTKTLMMLPTDMVLIKDRSFKQWVNTYAKDQDKFFGDFSKALTKLFELGVPFASKEEDRLVLKRTE